MWGRQETGRRVEDVRGAARMHGGEVAREARRQRKTTVVICGAGGGRSPARTAAAPGDPPHRFPCGPCAEAQRPTVRTGCRKWLSSYACRQRSQAELAAPRRTAVRMLVVAGVGASAQAAARGRAAPALAWRCAARPTSCYPCLPFLDRLGLGLTGVGRESGRRVAECVHPTLAAAPVGNGNVERPPASATLLAVRLRCSAQPHVGAGSLPESCPPRLRPRSESRHVETGDVFVGQDPCLNDVIG